MLSSFHKQRSILIGCTLNKCLETLHLEANLLVSFTVYIKYFFGEPYHIELTHTDSSPNNCPSSAKPNCDTPIHLSNYYHDEQAHNTHRQTTSNSFHFVKKIFG